MLLHVPHELVEGGQGNVFCFASSAVTAVVSAVLIDGHVLGSAELFVKLVVGIREDRSQEAEEKQLEQVQHPRRPAPLVAAPWPPLAPHPRLAP
eukprot:1266005-Pyramimonas_sp.AAC.1